MKTQNSTDNTPTNAKKALAGNHDAAPPPATAAAPSRWAWLVATFFGVGMLRPGPGTWGSLAAVLSWAAIAHAIPAPQRSLAAFAAAALVTAIGIPAATRFARAVGAKDPQQVVIDEVAGQLLTLALAPLTWKVLAAGFILFRAFDILKPWPIRRLEKLPEGTGIVMDDLGAGVYASLVLQLLLRAGILS
jgi:phosphatidylglycerophosphatase A